MHHFIGGPEKETNMKASAVITQSVHIEFKYLFTGIGCFKGTFSLQSEMVPNHSSRCVAHALQQPFKDKLD